MKKRLIAILLIAVMLMSSMVTYADKSIKDNAFDIIKNQVEIMRLKLDNVESFVAILKDLIPLMLAELKDIKESDWFKDNLALLYGMKIVEGDGKGNFLPNKEVTASEYLKMVVVALDNKNYKPVNGQWDKPYIDRALELGLIKKGEIANYRKPLNRYNMARVIVRACKEEYGDYNQYQGNVKDFSSIPNEYKEYVLKAYSKGIITGYTDGTFKGDNTMRRSEATAVIARLIDPSQRKMPEKIITEKDINEFMKNIDPRISRTAVTSPIIINGEIEQPNTIAANNFAREWLNDGFSMGATNSKDVDELMEKMADFAIDWMVLDNNIDYRNIDEYRKKAEQMLQQVHVTNYLNKTIKRYVDNKLVMEAEFYTDKNLVVVNPSMGIRGTVKFRYLEPTKPEYAGKNIKLNTWYEADVQLNLYITNKGEIKANGYRMIKGTRREVGGN